MLLRLLLLTTTLATVVTGDVGDGGGAVDTGPPRSVMELMEVMLNRELLAMLRDGGFDFRPPSRLFLPPKFYSHVPLDRGHMTPEQIFGIPEKSSPGAVVVVDGGKTQHQKGVGAPAGAPASSNTASSPGAPRINLISYSDSKVTFSAGGKPVPGGAAGGTVAANKGSATLERNVGTNVKSLQPPLGQQHRATGSPGARTPNDLPLTTSITDQTVVAAAVSPTGGAAARTLPASGRSFGGPAPARSGSGATATERLRAALPGEPDVDYPILGSIPSTAFSCENRPQGYYADVETRCQVFRVCANTDASGRGFAFLCPNGTLFNQRFLVCDWYMNVRCEASPDFYHLNQDIGRMSGRPMVSPDRDVMMEAVRSMMTYPMRSLMRMMQGGVDSTISLGDLDTGRTLATKKGGSSRSSYSVPSLGLEAPFQQQQQLLVRPINAGLQGSTTVTASQDSSYTPPLNKAYVSSLGTLSTENNSGFDPVRSTVLTPSAPVRLSPPQPSQNRFASPNQRPTNGASTTDKVSELQILPAGLVKYWDGRESATTARQPPTLKLKPVPQQPFAGPELAITPRPIRPILPPTGVLPPSTFLRTLAPQQQSLYRQQPASGNIFNVPSAQHRFTPFQKVVAIQKATVLPEPRPQPFSSGVTSFGSSQNDVSYQAASDQRQILRRIDVDPGLPRPGYRLENRKPGFVELQVVPALSYYLNDPLEQQAFDEAVQHGLLDERRHESYRRWAAQPSYARSSSSYDVPQGSVGQLVTRHHP
uniref:Uncharacterized protein n=1 Tax=Anopheles albimanus TaxID=7167 RepID=A0A182FHB9_ANOAL